LTASRIGIPGLPGFRVLPVLLIAAAVAVAGLATSGTSVAGAKFKQPGCSKFAKQKKKAKGKAKKQRAKSKLKQCKANRKAYNQVKDSRFVGTRSDGEPVDIILCANGKFADDYGSSVEQIYRKGWRITDARVKGKNFTAAYEALIEKSPVGNTGQTQVAARTGSLVKKNGKWQSGAENSGKPYLAGDVEKTDAKKECRKL
jgi:hypothetical protein